jgi:CheY-like chemotaxis protein
VILLDLSMLVMNGWRFREHQLQLRERELAATPVVVMSAPTSVRKLRARSALPARSRTVGH